jgi:hypothetical protein
MFHIDSILGVANSASRSVGILHPLLEALAVNRGDASLAATRGEKRVG